MSDTGFKSPASYSQSSGANAWSNPGNVLINGQYAELIMSEYQNDNKILLVSGYGLNIPENAVITKIEVKVTAAKVGQEF